jgi:hypothetical protein
MTISTNSGTIQALYLAYFQRPADPKGLAFWVDALDSGMQYNIGADFARSYEYRALVDGKSHAEVIDTLYLNLFGNRADPAGLSFYKDALESGKTTVDAVAAEIMKGAVGSDFQLLDNKIVASQLFSSAMRIEQLYASNVAYNTKVAQDYLASVSNDASVYAALGKLPDLLEIVMSTSTAASPGAPGNEHMIAPLAITNESRVQQLHLAYFKRPATVGEMEAYSTALARTSFAAVSSTLSQSKEYADSVKDLTREQVVDRLYKNLFGRDGDLAGVKFYSEALEAGKVGVDELVRIFIDGAAGNDREVMENRMVGAEIFTTALRIESALGVAYAHLTAPGQAYIDSIGSDAAAYDAVRGLPQTLQDLAKMMNTPTGHAELSGAVELVGVPPAGQGIFNV